MYSMYQCRYLGNVISEYLFASGSGSLVQVFFGDFPVRSAMTLAVGGKYSVSRSVPAKLDAAPAACQHGATVAELLCGQLLDN